MQFFYWNPSYEVGIESIDQQHKKLIDLINELGSAITTEIEVPKLAIIINTLRDYIDFHFRDEEKIFEKSGMPEKDQIEHKHKHHIFEKKVATVLAKKDLNDVKAAEEFFDFLVVWLVQHILVVDRTIPQYLAGNEEILETSEGSETVIARTLINALNESEKRFRLLSDNAPVMIWITDEGGNKIFHNKVWGDFIEENANSDDDIWYQIIHPDDRNAYVEYFRNLLADPRQGDFEYRARNKEGEYCYFLERIIPRMEDSGHFMGFASSTIDITTLKEAEDILMKSNISLEIEVEKRTQEIQRLMLTDILTNTKNRRFLMEQLGSEISRGQRYGTNLALIFLDIDHFKMINDDFGHLAGDHILSSTAALMMKELRDCDYLCRYGGEEFVALLPETSLEQAALIAERIIATIRKTKIPEIGKAITMSAGVGLWQKGESKDNLLERCDRALYSAKNGGRDQVNIAS